VLVALNDTPVLLSDRHKTHIMSILVDYHGSSLRYPLQGSHTHQESPPPISSVRHMLLRPRLTETFLGTVGLSRSE
jgi:hypothetical protein